MSALFDLHGEVAVVTGGAGLLGTRMSEALAAHGASVAVLDRDGARAARAAQEIAPRSGSRVVGLQVDVGDRAQLRQARVRIERELGAATVLVNAAATKSAGFFEPFETFSSADWDEVFRTNVTGVMRSCQEFGVGMAARGQGSIVNILSIYGIAAPDQRIYEGSLYEGHPINTPAVYSTSKAAVWGLTRYLATYWARSGIRVNAVTPGGVFSGQNDTFVKRYSERVPMGRMATRDEMSGAVAFLASNASSYVTGQNIIVDGGLTVW